jgi:protein-disulfide isomerase
LNSNSGKKKSISIAAGVAIAIAIMAGIMVSNSGGSNVSTGTVQQTIESATEANKLSFSSLTSGGSPARGNSSAPVTLVEFSDFQCSNCGRFAKNTEPQIVKEYISTGQVNMVYKHFPLRGPDSVTASMASQCANDQGKFWEFHDLLFNNQKAEGSGWASSENMKKFASELGLDSGNFDSCLDSDKYRSFVENDFAFTEEIGVTGTPTFIVVKSNGSAPEEILGAQPFSSFKAVLDKKIGS